MITNLIQLFSLFILIWRKRSLRGAVANLQSCKIVEDEFELQSSYYVLFQSNAPKKGMNPLIPPAMG